MRVLGIDYGDKRIGFALSDQLRIIASPLEVYNRKSLRQDLEHIKKIIDANQVDTIVIGLPINMDGTLGDRAIKTREFGEQIKQIIDLPIVYIDERWTSKESERVLIQSNVRRERRKTLVDKIAAQNILQRYLDMPKSK
ncbi:MAG TPA: Holliday junction resolvase RuvX [Clostridiales bacterium]|nr:Holliday junction resolvase RuvX [Clostridiales bacterium]